MWGCFFCLFFVSFKDHISVRSNTYRQILTPESSKNKAHVFLGLSLGLLSGFCDITGYCRKLRLQEFYYFFVKTKQNKTNNKKKKP